MNLSPLPIQKFFSNDGKPLVGGLLFTYQAGTSTPQATYTDSSGMTPNSNPIVLDFRGEAEVWIDIDLTYKFILSPADDTDPPTKPIWTVDNIAAPITFQDLTRQIIGRILFPITEAEIEAGVTPEYYYHPPGNVLRYGNNSTPGTTDTTGAVSDAIAQAIQNGGAPIFANNCFGDTGITSNDYAITGPLSIGGPAMFVGEKDRLSFAGPRYVRTNNASGTAEEASLFTIAESVPLSATFENTSFSYSGNTAVNGAGLVYINPVSGGPNSIYFRGCWFQQPMYYAIQVSGVDDVNITSCTFDVTAQKFLGFGGQSAGNVSNAAVTNNTFYAGQVQSIGLCDIARADGFLFSNNRVYTNAAVLIPYGINADSSTAVAVRNLVVTANSFKYVNSAVQISSNVLNTTISGNSFDFINGAPAISGGGGTPISNVSISGNTIRGYSAYPQGLIDFSGTPIRDSVISGNSIICLNGATVSVTATNASPCVFTGTIPNIANGMPIFLAGTAVPTGFTEGTTYFAVGVSGSNFSLSATLGGSAINSSSTGTAVTATPMTAYGVVMTGSDNNGTVAGPNAISGYAISAYNVTGWAGLESGTVGPIGLTLVLADVAGTPSVAATYSVCGNMVTLSIPETVGAADGTNIRLLTLPADIRPTVERSGYQIIVHNNSVYVSGTLSIATTGIITLGVGPTAGAFSNTGNQGVGNATITYQLS